MHFSHKFFVVIILMIIGLQPLSADTNPDLDGSPDRDDPRIIVQPEQVRFDLDLGESREIAIQVSNEGDDPLIFTSYLDIVAHPDNSDFEHMQVLIITTGEGRGGDHAMLEAARSAGIPADNIVEMSDHEIPEIDLFDYDVIVCSDAHPNMFYQAFNWNREQFVEWVEAGGTLIMNVYTAGTIPSLVLPGGATHYYSAGNGWDNTNLQVQGCDQSNPLISGFVDDEDDDLPAEITGAPASRTFFYRPFLIENLDNGDLENLQLFYKQSNTEDNVTLFTYEVGQGNVCAATLCVSGYWYMPDDLVQGEWMEEARLFARNEFAWADWLNRTEWITYGQEAEIEIGPGGEQDLVVAFDATGMLSGDYETDLHILSNDGANEDVTVSIIMTVSETPDIMAEWNPRLGFPDFLSLNGDNEFIYSGIDYVCEIEIINEGSGDLQIESITIDGQGSESYSIEPAENFDPIQPRNSIEAVITFNGDAAGDHIALLTISSNDPDEEEYEIELVSVVAETPDIGVRPERFDIEILGAEIVNENLIIENDGEGELEWKILTEFISDPAGDDEGQMGPRRDFPGEILDEFDLENDEVDDPNDMIVGLITNSLAWDYDNEWMWSVNTLTRMMIAVNPHNDYETMVRWGMETIGRPWDIAYYDGIIYSLHAYNNWIERIDTEGNILDRLHPDMDDGAYAAGLAIDSEEELLFVMGKPNQSPEQLLYVYTIEGERIAQAGNISELINREMSGPMEWVPGHLDGQLWVHTVDALWQISVDTVNWEVQEVVQRIDTFGSHWADGFAHDGENMWITAMETGTCQVIDDGEREVKWLTVTPLSGVLPSRREQFVQVIFNGGRQSVGDYEAILNINSNDPDEALIRVPINLTIEAAPQLEVRWPVAAGFDVDEMDPDVNWNEYFQDVLAGVVYEIPVTFRNYGAEPLQVSDVTSESEFFSADTTEFELGYLESRIVNFILESDQTGEFESTMIIDSNDPINESIEVPLTAIVSEPPEIFVNPEEIIEDLIAGETMDIMVTIANDGGVDLRWNSRLEIVLDEEERDNSSSSERTARRIQIDKTPTQFNLTNKRLNDSNDRDPSPPRRDESETRYLIYQDNVGYGWVFENLFQTVEDIDYDWVDNVDDLSNVDLDDYDVLWIESGSQSPAFDNYWNGNIGRFEEWVADGNSMYIEQGQVDLQEPTTVAPGGLTYERDRQQGVLAIGPEDHWVVQQMGWERGLVFRDEMVITFSLGAYPIEALEAIENSDGYQVITIGSTHRNPTIVEYNYGHGTVIVTSAYPGRQWFHENGEGQWGSCGETMLQYLAMRSEKPWVRWRAERGTIEPGSEQDIVVTLDSKGLFTGEYNAILHILSNDPFTPDFQLPITIGVEGFPIADLSWSEDFGYPDEINYNLAFEELYATGVYPVEVTIANVGTDTLHIGSISSDDVNKFHTDWNEDEQSFIPPQDISTINVILQVEDDGEFRGTITFVFDDDAVDNIEVEVMGETSLGPILVVNPDAINENLLTGERSDHVINISNGGAVLLEWYSEAEILQEPGEDQRAAGPRRDEAGDLIVEFEIDGAEQNDYRNGVAWDRDNEWMWISQVGLGGNPGTIFAIDPFNDYEVVTTLDAPGMVLDMFWYEGVLYVIDYGLRGIRRYDAEGNNLGQIVDENMFPGGIAVSPELELIFIMEYWPDRQGRPIHVYEISENGGLGEEIALIEGVTQQMADIENNNYMARSILWVDDHESGQLWLHSGGQSGSIAWQFEINTEDWTQEYVQHFETFGDVQFGSELDGLGHDGENLWATNVWSPTVRIFDDGINEKGWISWRAQSGELEAGGEDEITVTLNAQGLIEGEYIAELYLFSNDPAELVNADVTIPITLNVEANPSIHIIPGGIDEEPVVLDHAYFGYRVSTTVLVQNLGMGILSIEEVIGEEGIPDIYVEVEDIEGLDIWPGEEIELNVWYEPSRERPDSMAVTLRFFSNDMNFQEGYSVQCISGGASEAPILVLDPDEFQIAMDADDERDFGITVSNEGGSVLEFQTEFVVMAEPERDRGISRSSRSIGRDSKANQRKEGRIRDPRRDEPAGRGLLIQNSCGWYAWDFEQYFEAIDGFEYDRVRQWNQLDNVDLHEYDFIWIGNFESDGWVGDMNDNRERIEDFVDRGGAIYHSSGTGLYNIRPTLPGGLEFFGAVAQGQTECPIVLDPEDNYFINYMNENDPTGWNWGDGQLLIGFRQAAPAAIGYFRVEDIEEIDNSDWYETMAVGGQSGEPIVLTYRYGHGYCFVSTMLDGYHHRWPDTAQWGRTAPGIIYYLDHLTTNIETFSIDPLLGEIEPDSELECTLTVNTTDLIGGDYEVDLHFYSNDPENPDQIVDIFLRVSATAEISGVPIPYPVEGAEDVVFEGDHYPNNSYDMEIEILNVGGEELVVDSFEVLNGDFWEFRLEEEDRHINPMQSVTGQLTFTPNDVGQFGTQVYLFTNAENVENGEAWWIINSVAVSPPDIDIQFPNNADSLIVEMGLGEDPVQQALTISNAEGDQRGDLRFHIVADHPDGELVQARYRNRASLFSNQTEDAGPRRDEPGTILHQFDSPLLYTTGMTFDGELMWGSAYEQGTITSVSSLDFSTVSDFHVHRTPVGLAFDGEFLWVGRWGYTIIYIYDLEGELIEEFDSELRPISMTADDDGNMLILNGLDDRIHMINIESREEVRVFNQNTGFEHDATIGGIEWVPEHPDGQLWGLSSSNVYQAYVDEEYQTYPVQNFEAPEANQSVWAGPAHDGEHMWIGSRGITWYVVDDGVIEYLPGWLSVNPSYGEVPAGESNDISVGFRTDRLEENTLYEAAIIIETNDPDEDLVSVDIYLRTIGMTVSEDPLTPKEYSLSQNYPNPFNSITRMNFGLPTSSQVKISVYDLSGRLVSTLQNANYDAGNHEISWDASTFSTGLYLIRMETDQFTSVRKATIIK